MKQTFTPGMLRILAESEEFQSILSSDEILDRLEAMQYDSEAEDLALLENLGLRTCIGKLSVNSVTPAIWALLCREQNPLIYGEDAAESELDSFLFLLHEGPGKAPEKGYCRETGLDMESIQQECRKRIKSAFLPFTLLPSGKSSAEEKDYRFDADWLNRICSAAAVRTATPIRDVIHHTSLNQVCWQYINHLREHDREQKIRRRPAEETAKAILNRTYELGRDYLLSRFPELFQ